MLRPVFPTLVGIAMLAAPLHGQQARTAEEKAIWTLIEASGTGFPKATDDIVFVSDAYPRPIIGLQPVAPEDTATASAETKVEQRTASVLKMRPHRVAVSASGDMAYGFALFDMEFDRPDSTGQTEHVKFEGSQLSEWPKIGGEWRLAASFNRPND